MKYEMRTEKPTLMDNHNKELLSQINIAPYIQLGTTLITKSRKAGGNMFRHQMDTYSVLIDYGYIDSILLKASVIHDCIEDIPDFDSSLIKNCDEDGEDVLNLVLEVSKKKGESKPDFLKRIINNGSQRAKVLKTADRISNMTSLGYVTEPKFIEKTCNDTEFFLLPLAILVDYNMYQELIKLLESRRKYLELINYFTN